VTWNAKARRRWLGILCLALAAAMLLAGETVLDGRLRGLGLAIYWLFCFLFTTLAIFVALLDARAVGLQSREDQRRLFEDTLRAIETEKRSRKSNDPHDRTR
jgi:hypothetical protein